MFEIATEMSVVKYKGIEPERRIFYTMFSGERFSTLGTPANLFEIDK